MVITFVVIGLEGSFLVKHITRFTEEIFTIVISLIFIYEVVKKMKAVSISVFFYKGGKLIHLTVRKDKRQYSVIETDYTPYIGKG